MSKPQRIVVAIGLLVIVAMLLVPPWQVTYHPSAKEVFEGRGLPNDEVDRRIALKTYDTFSYALAWHRPAPQEPTIHATFTWHGLDYELLALQVAAAIALTVAVALLLAPCQRT